MPIGLLHIPGRHHSRSVLHYSCSLGLTLVLLFSFRWNLIRILMFHTCAYVQKPGACKSTQAGTYCYSLSLHHPTIRPFPIHSFRPRLSYNVTYIGLHIYSTIHIQNISPVGWCSISLLEHLSKSPGYSHTSINVRHVVPSNVNSINGDRIINIQQCDKDGDLTVAPALLQC
jgi:hypothetical protein